MARILAARNGRVQNSPPMIKRCWVGGDDPLMLAYHDEEWGAPVRDDRALFGKLVLDGFQAGLSWRVILHKRAFSRCSTASTLRAWRATIAGRSRSCSGIPASCATARRSRPP